MLNEEVSSENKLPIGTSSFQKMVQQARKERLQFVDKTPFIAQVLKSTNEVMLFTRPRRFGKSTNLSMLYYFLSDENPQENRDLFKGLAVESNAEIMAEQGKHPVIMLNLKGLKVDGLDLYLIKLRLVFSELYRYWQPVLRNFLIEKNQKGVAGILEDYNAIMEHRSDSGVLQNALKQLTYYIYSATGKKPWILIDEYDGAIYHAFTYGYHRPALEMLSAVLAEALKDNQYFHKAIMTGILRIVKESIFSGLNNIGVYSFQNSQYNDVFGFTGEEVRHLIAQRPSPIGQHEKEFKALSDWYNGYESGGVTIYNPWSIACYMQAGTLLHYWVNTGDEGIFRTLLLKGNSLLKKDFAQLLLTGQIKKSLTEFLNFGTLEASSNQIWSIMVASGYLKAVDYNPISSDSHILISPNYEVTQALKSIAASILTEEGATSTFAEGLKGLANEGDPELLIEALQDIFYQSASFHDLPKGGENFVHGLILGIVGGLNDDFMIESNKESGEGRYDIALFPKDLNRHKFGIIIELKLDRNYSKKKKMDADEYSYQLQELAKEAVEQIVAKNYAVEFNKKKITQVIAIGITFGGKYLEGSWRQLA